MSRNSIEKDSVSNSRTKNYNIQVTHLQIRWYNMYLCIVPLILLSVLLTKKKKKGFCHTSFSQKYIIIILFLRELIRTVRRWLSKTGPSPRIYRSGKEHWPITIIIITIIIITIIIIIIIIIIIKTFYAYLLHSY